MDDLRIALERQSSETKLLFRTDIDSKSGCRCIVLGAVQLRHVSTRDGSVELHRVPARQLLPLHRHDLRVAVRSRKLSGQH